MKWLLALLIAVSSVVYAHDAKVLVVAPDPFIRNALVRRLQMEGYHYVREEACEKTGHMTALFSEFHPDFVIVDGTKKDPTDTMIIDTQVITACYNSNVKRAIVLSPVDVYPPNTKLPFKEDSLLELKRETLKDPRQIAKITALAQCHENNGLKKPRFIFCPYTYLAGPHDTGFTQDSSHPVKNIATRILKAKWQKNPMAVISNDGRARYELMHIDDMASAVVYLLTAPVEDEVINIAYGSDTNIRNIAEYIKSHLKFEGRLIYDSTSFDDVARTVLDNSRLTALGWYPTVPSQDIIKDTVLWLETKLDQPYNALEETPFILP